MRKFIKNNFYPLILALIIGVLCYANYTPGTFLSGWDTLQPELNLPLAFSRTFSIWRSDQGLGTVAIQSHMADLPHLIYLFFASLVLPVSLLRYSYFFLMLFLGPLGVYSLSNNILRAKKSFPESGNFDSGNETTGIAFFSSLIYLANLGTVQHFNVPLEMFATQYGLLPWIMFLSIKLFQKITKKRLILFALVSFFLAPSAQTATLWYAFFLAYFLFLIAYCFLHKHTWKKAIVIIAITFSTNAFWLLPNIYATVTHGAEVSESKINRMFTPEAIAKGERFGTLDNTAILKNFLFDWEMYDYKSEPQEFTQVLAPWNDHLKNPWVRSIGYGVWGLSLLGIYIAFRKRQKILLALVPVYGISLLMLLGGVIHLPQPGILTEALRFPFTKFSILYMMSLSVLAGYGLMNLEHGVSRTLKIIGSLLSLKLSFVDKAKLFYPERNPKNFTKHSVPALYTLYNFITCFLLLIYFLPAFGGNLINPAMRINIPQAYFDEFTWFNSQDHTGRVALLPMTTFWNWVYYDWGYQGAGFLQFGIPQPILDRDYDRWGPANEQYQREMSYAVYSMKPELLKSVLEKFNIQWVVVDESVQHIGGRPEATYTWILPTLLEKTGIAKIEKKFGEHIVVYNVQQSQAVYSNLPSIGPKLDGAMEDTAYSLFGPYITYDSGPLRRSFSEARNQVLDPYREAFSHDERFIMDVSDKKLVASFSATKTYTSTNTSTADHIPFSDLDHASAYLLSITHKNTTGFPLQMCVSDPYNRRCDLDVNLHPSKTKTTEQFLLPPLADLASGYTVDVNNFTIPGKSTINTLFDISIYRINYDKIIGRNTALPPAQTNTVITNNQAFDPGWLAMEKIPTFPYFRLLNNHVLLNNWSNGWILNNPINKSAIVFFYWPQLLEWVGFLLVPISLWILLQRTIRQKLHYLFLKLRNIFLHYFPNK
jgi:hypothetical protein